jgi:hypothetical protein
MKSVILACFRRVIEFFSPSITLDGVFSITELQGFFYLNATFLVK